MFREIQTKGVPIKAWVEGVSFDERAEAQLRHIAELPIVHRHVAAMPDVHVGIGATVGSVVATKKAIIPAAVGVDIGCGMIAQRTSLGASDLPDSLGALRSAIEAAVPHGRTHGGGDGDRGAWSVTPKLVDRSWATLHEGSAAIQADHPRLGQGNGKNQLGTLGTGNHFIEVCLDEADRVWVMLHSGSRGVGNRIGSYFIARAREEALKMHRHLPDQALSWLDEGTKSFDDYVRAVTWAQAFARENRAIMLAATLQVLSRQKGIPPFRTEETAVNCHHNYVEQEDHFGERVFVTRKGAVRAREGDLGIIPGSMGARSYIVRGRGHPESFASCSHGAGRTYSRTAARELFTLEDHRKATEGIECRKDDGVLDETPGAYKPIDLVMKAQEDLVTVVHELRQVLCVKG